MGAQEELGTASCVLSPWGPPETFGRPLEDLGEMSPKGGGPLGSGEKGHEPSFSFPRQAYIPPPPRALIQRRRSGTGAPSGWWESDGPEAIWTGPEEAESGSGRPPYQQVKSCTMELGQL